MGSPVTFGRLRGFSKAMLLVLLFLPVKAHVSAEGMYRLDETLPFGVRGAAAVWTGSESLLFGGDTGVGDYTNQIVRFDPRSGASEVMEATLPVAVWGAAAFWDGTYAYVLGGTTGPSHRENGYRSEISRYDPVQDEVSVLPTGLPVAVAEAAIAWNKENAYLVGGGTHIIEFDPRTGFSAIVGGLPEPRIGPSAIWAGENVLIFDGTEHLFDPSSPVLTFDPVTRVIDVLEPSFPIVSQKHGSAVWTGSVAFLFPGSGNLCSDHCSGWIHALDPLTAELARFRVAEYADDDPIDNLDSSFERAAVWAGDRAYLFGGCCAEDMRMIHEFDPCRAHMSSISQPQNSAPCDVEAQPVAGTDDEVLVTWTAPRLEPGADTVTGYSVSRRDPGGSYARIVTLDASARQFVDTDAAGSATWQYAVRAIRSDLGDSVLSHPANVKMRLPDAPRFEGAALDPVAATATIRWQSPSDFGPGTLLSYRVYRGTHTDAKGFVEEIPVAELDLVDGAFQFTDTNQGAGLPLDRPHLYELRAVTTEGEGPPSAQAPGAPENVVVSHGGQGRLRVSWEAPSDDGGAAITGYRVYRGPTPSDMMLLGEVSPTAVEYEDGRFAPGMRPYYAVSAANVVGEGERSRGAAPPSAVPADSPFAALPTSVSATVQGELVEITWEAPSDRDAPSREVFAYRIYGAGLDGIATLIGAQPATSQAHLAAAPQPGASMEYRVSAVGIDGEGPATGPVVVTRPFGVATPNVNQVLRLSIGPGGQVEVSTTLAGSATGGGVASVDVYRGRTSEQLVLIADGLPPGTVWQDAGAEAPGTTWSYQTIGRDGLGRAAAASSVASLFVQPNVGGSTAPRSVEGTSGPERGEATVAWQLPADVGSATLLGWHVYRTDRSAPEQRITTHPVPAADACSAAGCMFTDLSGPEGEWASYRVSAVTSSGEGAASTAEVLVRALTTPSAPRLLSASGWDMDATDPGSYPDTSDLVHGSAPFNGVGTWIELHWTRPLDNGGLPVTGYVVLRSGEPNGPTVVAGHETDEAYKDGPPHVGMHYYRVNATNAAGPGQPSNEASAYGGIIRPQVQGSGFDVTVYSDGNMNGDQDDGEALVMLGASGVTLHERSIWLPTNPYMGPFGPTFWAVAPGQSENALWRDCTGVRSGGGHIGPGTDPFANPWTFPSVGVSC